jgi:cytochrome bd-type quinol oxidase subunit 2
MLHMPRVVGAVVSLVGGSLLVLLPSWAREDEYALRIVCATAAFIVPTLLVLLTIGPTLVRAEILHRNATRREHPK